MSIDVPGYDAAEQSTPGTKQLVDAFHALANEFDLDGSFHALQPGQQTDHLYGTVMTPEKEAVAQTLAREMRELSRRLKVMAGTAV